MKHGTDGDRFVRVARGLAVAALLLAGTVGLKAADQVTFYTLPIDSAARRGGFTGATLPGRIFLSGRWQVLEKSGSAVLGAIQQPFSYRENRSFRFRKKFRVPDSLLNLPNLQARLHLGRVNGDISVILNQTDLEVTSAPFLPVEVTAPVAALKRENVLDVVIQPDGQRWRKLLPWLPVNVPLIEIGLQEPAWLEILPSVHLEQLHSRVVHRPGGTRLQLRGQIEGPTAQSARWRLQVVLSHNHQEVTRTQTLHNSRFKVELPLKPAWAWEPEQPEPVRLTVQLWQEKRLLDRWTQTIAWRKVSLQEGRVQLNGAGRLINGINYLYQHPTGSTLFDADQVRWDLQQIKTAGYNAVRVPFAPLPESFYALCDHLGVLVFQDLPLLHGLIRPEADSLYRVYQNHLLDQMVSLASRHPSVVGIGVSYFADPAAPALQHLLRQLPDTDSLNLILYVDTPFPPESAFPTQGVWLWEVLDRRKPEVLTHLSVPGQGPPVWPVAFQRALSYRVDSTLLAPDLIQDQLFVRQARHLQKNGRLPVHFIPTFCDYRVNFPALQNGLFGRLDFTAMGLYTLDRHLKTLPSKASLQSQSSQPVISEARSRFSFLYILSSLLALFVFLLAYQQSPDFRRNVSYSLKRPHGFFVNLQERILIPHGQTLFLLGLFSLTGAVVLHSILFYFRSNFLMDYLLSLIAFTPAAKRMVAGLIWKQWQGLALLTVSLAGALVVSALLLRLFALGLRKKMVFREALVVNVWALTPLLFLMPLAVLLYNLLLSLNSYWIVVGLLLIFVVWIYLRWINGIRVFLDALYPRVFVAVTFLGGLCAGGIMLFLQSRLNLLAHLKLIYHLYRALH